MEPNLKGLRVLLVDDSEIIRIKISKDLESIDLIVTTATNGFDALAKLRDNPFDIVFTDIVMPEMDGFELTEEIRRTPEIQILPIVVISSHCENEYILKALRLGADDYINKPIDISLLKKVIQRALTPTLLEDDQ